MDKLFLSGVKENNLKNLSLSIPHDRFVVISGLSGSGKSTLAFDTIYAEGGRRYIETFSPYTRQFLDRLQPPALDSVENVRPALALEQRNRITSSRSTVGTVTEINDYLKVLWSQFSELHCEQCEAVITREPIEVVVTELLAYCEQASPAFLVLSFELPLQKIAKLEALKSTLLSEGHIRYLNSEIESDDFEPVPVSAAIKSIENLEDYPDAQSLHLVVDRIALTSMNPQELRSRIRSSVAQGYTYGRGVLKAWFGSKDTFPNHSRTFCESFRCSSCNTEYPPPRPSLFSFNSPLGACAECHGFGKILELDPETCIADRTRSIADGAVQCWDTDATAHLKRRLIAFCNERGIDTTLPWRKLKAKEQAEIFDGNQEFGYKGIRAWFSRLERKRHKMHVRVLLSRYRREQDCHVCKGTRLSAAALRYRIAGYTLPEIWNLPVDQVLEELVDALEYVSQATEIAATAVAEIKSRLRYLCDIGLPYLTLNRQSRTLSGGESQRVNLTSLLGSRLVHTMLVLDEPTIGLHPRDTAKLIESLQQLRNRGNSLVVVEHDPDVLRAADHILDLGPDAGANGGELIAHGSVQDLLDNTASRTGRYLAGKTKKHSRVKQDLTESPTLRIKNASAHNLKDISVTIPLQGLVCVTGASGSGKSTLIHTCLYQTYEQLKRGLTAAEIRKSRTIPVESLTGLEALDEILLIDQSPIGKSPRSNPATYTKAWDTIRETLAATAAAEQLGLSKSAFSFNVDGGRCPACKGAGQIKVEMQFLADVYVHCELCGGTRFQESVRAVTIAGKSVVDLLHSSILEVVEHFNTYAESDVARKLQKQLQPLITLGLGYLRLGHPLSALSGGEAQRVKLASYLSERSKKRCLFILDEPSTGLHPDNIADLLTSFDSLLACGHSVLCIEHNLDIIEQADWIIDLGPAGGTAGGEVLFCDTPEAVVEKKGYQKISATAVHLKRHTAQRKPLENAQNTVNFRPQEQAAKSGIQIRGAREHNLQNVSLELPEDKIIAITGVSGSGKSTLAFDILFAEGQRRYINCLSPYARQYIKQLAQAEVDQVLHLPPTIAVSQKTAPPSGISTVATTTEIYQYLRLLFAKAAVQHCIYDDTPITSRDPNTLVEQILREYKGQRVQLFAPVVSGRKGYYNDLFLRALRAGITEAKIDGGIVSLTEDLRLERHKLHYISLAVASLKVVSKNKGILKQAVEQCLVLGNGVVELYTDDLHIDPEILSVDRVCPTCNRGYHELDPQDFSFRSQRGVCESCSGRGQIPTSKNSRSMTTCPECDGARIAAIGRHVYYCGQNIASLTARTAPELLCFLEDNEADPRLANVTAPIRRELEARLRTIIAIGLDYLPLNRDASTISGGEAQRLRLAKTLGSPLSGVCYVLDEPSIGLHSQDHAQLLQTLKTLRDQGNTVVIVEHDEDTIRAADHVIDVGPGGGSEGGRIVFEGSVDALERVSDSRTAQALRQRGKLELSKKRIAKETEWIELHGGCANNLKQVDVRIPLKHFSVVCGVSGAGKSSLVDGTLVPAIVEVMEGEASRAEFYDKTWREIEGADSLERFLEIDQSPVGKTSSSAPVSYLGIFDRIRKIYAALPEAKARGWNASHFSFNTGKGRCPHCEGKGVIVIPMSFLPDATTPCEYCRGMRYNDETLEIEFQGVSIGALLQSTFAQAYELFVNHRLIQRSLSYVLELGLGYLSLGQATHTLSGGEAQRIKIARELGSRDASNTIYVLDEPTVGLHMTDVDKLRKVLQRLVDQGNTVVVIEHNLDMIRSADYLIELGPEAGDKGGTVLFQGSPQQLATVEQPTPTSRFITEEVEKKKSASASGRSGALNTRHVS